LRKKVSSLVHSSHSVGHTQGAAIPLESFY
jgi:hypothetical protein